MTDPGPDEAQQPEPPPPPPVGGFAPPPWSTPGGPGYGPPPYGAAPPGMYVDPGSGLYLPNGVALAGIGRRIGAFFLAIPLAIVTLGIGYVIWGLVVWPRGQTPTYQVLGMRCWRPQDGRTATFWWMGLREVIGRLAEGVLGFITELVSLILFVTTKDRRALHDLIAGTVVLHDPDKILGR